MLSQQNYQLTASVFTRCAYSDIIRWRAICDYWVKVFSCFGFFQFLFKACTNGVFQFGERGFKWRSLQCWWLYWFRYFVFNDFICLGFIHFSFLWFCWFFIIMGWFSTSLFKIKVHLYTSITLASKTMHVTLIFKNSVKSVHFFLQQDQPLYASWKNGAPGWWRQASTNSNSYNKYWGNII